MTRRTPKPGDSYSKEGGTLVVVDASKHVVVLRRLRDDSLHTMTLDQFHQAVAFETWGRP
jgi:hypothetical protein